MGLRGLRDPLPGRREKRSAPHRACPAWWCRGFVSALRQGLCSRERTQKGRSRQKKPVFVPKGPSDPPPPCIEPQYLESGRGKSSSRTPVGPS